MFGLNREKLQMVLPTRLSWLQGVVLWLVILSFVFFGIVAWGMGGSSGTGSGSGGEEQSLVAEVDGRKVTRQDFLRQLRATENNYRDRFGEQAEAFLRSMNIPQQVLDSLINREVALGEARNAGLRVSPAEVRDHIVATYVDEQGRFHGREVLRRIAAQNQYSESDFRQAIADELLVSKLQDLVATSAIVTDSEVRAEYLRRNDRAKIDYVFLDPSRLAAQETTGDPELRALYDADPQRFAVEERKARYVVFAASEFSAGADPSDEEVQAVWERERELRFAGRTEEEASAIIRTELKDELTRQRAREQASEALARFRDSADIAALADEGKRVVHESDFFPQSAPPQSLEGLSGDLTGVARALFAVVEKGKLAPFPIPVGDASVVIQWQDRRGPIVLPFEAARDAVVQAWRTNRGKAMAAELKAKLESALATGLDLAGAATVSGAEVQQSSPFSRVGPVPGVPDSAALAELAYQAPLRTTQSTQVGDGTMFFSVTERFALDEAKYLEDREPLRSSLSQRRQSEAWEEFLATHRRDLEARSKVRLTPLAAELAPQGATDARF